MNNRTPKLWQRLTMVSGDDMDTKQKPLKWEKNLQSVMQKTGWDREYARKKMIRAKKQFGIKHFHYDRYDFFDIPEEEQEARYQEILERIQRQRERKEEAVQELMRLKGIGHDEAEAELTEARKLRRIPYRNYISFRIFQQPVEKQEQYYMDCLQGSNPIAMRKAMYPDDPGKNRTGWEARNEFRSRLESEIQSSGSACAPLDPDDGSGIESILETGFGRNHAGLRYADGSPARQPASVFAAAWYLGIPLPRNATMEFQPSAYTEPIPGDLRSISRRLAPGTLPVNAVTEKIYEMFAERFRQDQDLTFNETDLAIYFTDFMFHCADYGYKEVDYFDYRFYLLEKTGRDAYLNSVWYMWYLRKVCVYDVSVFREKSKFNRYFEPFIRREWISPGEVEREDFAAFVQKHPVFFSKSETGMGGFNARVIDSRQYDPDSLYEELKDDETIAEECVKQHPALAEVNESSLNTVRVYSITDVTDTVRIAAAIIRFGRKGSCVDNNHSGGVSVSVDLETGKLADSGIDMGGRRYREHPDSGVVFGEFRIPEWEKLRETVKKLALYSVEKCRCTGWDMAVREDGTVEPIEGNTAHDLTWMQAVNRQGKKELFEQYIGPIADQMGAERFDHHCPDPDISNMQGPAMIFR